MMPSNLYSRVLLVVVALFVVAAAVSGILAALVLAETLDQQYRSKGQAIASIVAGASVDDILLERDAGSLQSLVDQYAETEGVSYILVHHRAGEVIAHTFAPEVPAELVELIGREQPESAYRLRVGPADHLAITAPILDGEIGYVHVGMDQAAIDAMFWRSFRRQGLGLGGVGLIAALAAYALVRRITRPLRLLSSQARRIAAESTLAEPARPLTIDLAPISKRPDEVGQLAGAIVNMLDTLAAREQQLRVAQQSLRHSEYHFRSLIENVDDIVALLDDDGHTRYLSPSFGRVLDFPAAEWLGRPLSPLIHDEDRPQFEVAVRHCAPTEVRMTRADGLWRLMDLTMTRRVSSDSGGIVATFRDITDRQRTQELEAAKETAEEASRLKSEFLTNVSHELFTPLHHVLGLTELTLASDLDREQRTDLEAVVASGQKLLALLRNLTALSSLEAGETRLDVGPFCPRLLLRESTAVLLPRAQLAGLRLTGEVRDEVPALLVGDAGRLRQVLLELLGNALEFTKRGEVSACLRGIPEGGDFRLEIEVADTGIGIEPDKQRAIFEPFVQGDGSLTREHGGAGLGLTVVRSLVGLMGGAIHLDSRPGVGSTFRVRVPLAVGSEKPPSAELRTGKEGGG